MRSHDQLLGEISDLKGVINELNYQKSDLINQVNAGHTQQQDLYREVITWKDMVNKITDENTQLKLIIEDLESKNKKLTETLNTHLYNRAAEYKARTLNALRGSPARIAQPPPPASYESPQRAPKTPERKIGNFNPGSATTQHPPMNSAERLRKMLKDDEPPMNDESIREMVRVDHDETKAMREMDEEHKDRSGVANPDFDYGNVLDRGQHGPDARLVNSNYSLISSIQKSTSSPGR